MKNHAQQCQKCRAINLPDSVYCSKCAHKLNYQGYIIPTKEENAKSLRHILILFAIVVPLALLFTGISSLNQNSSQSSLPVASTLTTSPPEIKSQFVSTVENAASTLTGKVVGVHDGDTCTVLDGNNKQWKIRFAGIDAPELGQDFGTKSKENLSRLIFGKTVQVITGKTDKYGRTVGKIIINGQDINLQQVKDGFAWHYKEYQKEQSEEDVNLYSVAEKAAKASRLGLWSQANPTAPWSYRHGDNVSPEDAKKIYGNKNSKIYHWAGCPGFNKLGVNNRVVFNSADEAESAGFRAAKNCTSPKPASGSTLEGESTANSKSSVRTPPAPSSSTRTPVMSGNREYITGPRGGCYYLNGNGNKTYVDRSFCGGNSEPAPPPKTISAPASSSGGYITGPRGGCYTLTSSGKKRYVDRSLCSQ